MQNYESGDSQSNSPHHQSSSNQIDHQRLVPYSDSDDQNDEQEKDKQFGSGPSTKRRRIETPPSESGENGDVDQIIDPTSNE